MPRINAFGYRLASFCFGIRNEMSGIADPFNGEVKTVQVHRMNSGRRINDPPVDCFALFVSETFGRRPSLAVDGEYAVSDAKNVIPFPLLDHEDAIVLFHARWIDDECSR